MKLRAFSLILTLALGLLAAPVPAEAQKKTGKVYRIGFLSADMEPSSRSAAFVKGLRDLGYVEGHHFVMEYRWAAGRNERLPQLAAELVRVRVDVIVTRGTASTLAAKAATRTVPIVFGSAGFPVEKGIVASLPRPGGNVTGLAIHVGTGKALELLKEAVPGVVRVVHLYDPSVYRPKSFLEATLTAAQRQAVALNLELQSLALRDPAGVRRAFAEFERGTSGLLLDNAGLVSARRQQICELALHRRLPAVGRNRRFSKAGCLASYGENVLAMYRRAATYVDRILKGAKPADPVERSTKFELVINLKTAKALGLTIPPSLLFRADRVIK